MEMHTEGSTAKRGGAMHKSGRHEHHARGGKAKTADKEKVNVYNAKDSPEVSEADNEEPDFKKGGSAHKKRAHGGNAEGEAAEARMDKPKRGKSHEKHAAGGRAGGHSPYSSGRALTMKGGDSGKEGQKVPEEPG